MNLHDAEPHQVARTSEEYRALFSLPQTTTFLAMNGEETVAYLMFGEGVNKPGLIEGGGDIGGLETLVKHILLEREADPEIQVASAANPIKSRTTDRKQETGEHIPY